MEALILKGESKSNMRLIIELARKLNFKAKRLSPNEIEELGIVLSINDGLQSGLLNEDEKKSFLKNMDKD